MAYLMWVISIAIVLLVVYMLPAIRRFKQRYDFAQTLTGPSIFGQKAVRKRAGGALKYLVECRRKYGPVFRIWVGLDLYVFFNDPDDVKTILKSTELIDKAKHYSFLEIWLGKGLLLNSGDDWRLKRKLLTPGFHFQILSSFKKPMEDCCEILIDRFGEVADGRAVDVYKYITLFAMDVICETAMGIKVNAQLNEESDFVRNTQRVCRLIFTKWNTVWQHNPFLYSLCAAKAELDETVKNLHDETKRVIKSRRSYLDTEIVSHGNGFEEKQRRPFLDSLLIAQRETGLLTDENIQEETDTFMFEGHDTTSSALSFGIFLLSKHPEVQQRLFEEVTTSDDSDWPYMDAVIKEILRIYPPVSTFARQSRKSFQVGKHLVPPGVTLFTNAFLVHRELDHYSDPECFRPERFLKEAPPVHPFAHIAFSAGPRNCIGQKFAMLELRSTLSKLLRVFAFSAVPNFNLQVYSNFILKSKNGIMVQIHKRKLCDLMAS